MKSRIILRVDKGRTLVANDRYSAIQEPASALPLRLQLAVAAFSSILLLSGCSDPAAEFEKAKLANTEEAFLVFERDFSSNPLAKEAKARRAELAYQSAMKSGKPEDLESFLTRFPDSDQAAAEKAYRDAIASTDPQAMRLFHMRYPDSPRCSAEKGVELGFSSGIMMSLASFFGGGDGGSSWSRSPSVSVSVKTSSGDTERMTMPTSEAEAIGIVDAGDSMAMLLPQPVTRTKTMDVVLCLGKDKGKFLVAASSAAAGQPAAQPSTQPAAGNK
jgi:hypothetical protein